MFENVYKNPVAKGQEYKAESMIKSLYEYYLVNLDKLPDEYRYMINELAEAPERVVCDYISGMSDQYSVQKFQEEFVPKFWKI
jgi:dGTPase